MKKRLLKETTTRRFMKLANIGTLTENFMDETVFEEDELDAPGDDLEPEAEEAPVDDELPMDAEMDDVVADDAPALDLSPAETEELLTAIGEKVEELTGNPVTVGSEDEPEMDMDAEPGVDDVEAEMPPGPEMGDELDEANISLEEDEVNEEDFLNEVTRRVAARLVEMSKK